MGVTVKTEILDSCPMCQSKRIREWCKGYDRLLGINEQIFTYSKCKNCRLVFLSERPLETEIYRYYPENYGPYLASGLTHYSKKSSPSRKSQVLLKSISYKIARRANVLVNKVYTNDFSRNLQRSYALNRQGSLLLDFGCGSDAFLNEARAKGWQTIGMDFSEQSVAQVIKSQHTGILYASEEAWNRIEDSSLDFVRMNHVLEHLYHPARVLEMIFRKMKPGATLHIAIPNPDGLSASVFRSLWHGLDCPRHIMLYSPQVLTNFLQTIGFQKTDLLFEHITKDFARSLGYYEAGKSLIAPDQVSGKMFDPRLQEILNVPAALAARLKKSDRFHAFATK
ncbi:MAG: hypothetical protein AVDCRST_MAG56-4903 [uncultured Cytophagales bacterium]|uniref:SAM-dependent methyltransferase n=1 Tax=uncultured Cytophagales bacterium TaxID=158755 RepID=A0A6J4JMT9_9SPHI|nr:MAG: hypothetical protein AVDCRST_MAG56-4903 [uncultured Cytophagales bacterium]